MTERADNELLLDLEFLDGSMRAQLVALRALLRHNPAAQKDLQAFLQKSEREGLKLNHTAEQDRGTMSTLRMLCS